MKSLADYSKQMQYNKITAVLIAVQTYRIGGVAFLWAMTQGIFDPAFAIPAGVGDMLIGLTAIPFAIFLWKGYSWSKYAVIVWSVLGIADLANAVSLSALINPDAGNYTLRTFPWVVIPAFAVPTAAALHVIVLHRLRNWAPIQAHKKLSGI